MLKLDIQFFAHKKGGGSTKNGRDSNAKRLGVKRSGENVGKGSDDTLFALKDGKVKFEHINRDRKKVSIVEIAQ